MADPSQKVVVITGCSSGVGLETAVLLAKEKKFKVIASMRNLQKKEALEKAAGGTLNKSLFIKELDVSKEDSMKSFVKSTYESEGRIDILINNAASGQHGAFESVSLEQMHALFQTNVFGTCRLTQEVVKEMKEREAAGRIIFISSILGIAPSPFGGFYAGSKHALEAIARSLAPVLKHFNIIVSIIEPGPISTPFAANIAENKQGRDLTLTNEDDSSMDPQTDTLRKNYLESYMSSGNRAAWMQTGKDVAEVILKDIHDEDPPVRTQTSEAMIEQAKKILVDPSGARMNDYYFKMMLAKPDATNAPSTK